MSRKTRKLIWSAPLVAVLAVAGALALFVALAPNGAQADHVDLPGAVTDLKAEADGTKAVDLSWDAPSDGGTPTSYRIDASGDGQTWTPLVTETDDASNSYRDDTIVSFLGTDRFYRVFAMNEAGTGPVSQTAGPVSVPDAGAPGDVTGISATAMGREAIVLSWSEPSNTGGTDEITKYVIAGNAAVGNTAAAAQVAETALEDVTVNGLPAANDVDPDDNSVLFATSDASTTYTLEGLIAGQTWFFHVYAYNGEQTSADAAETVSATTDSLGKIGPATGLRAVADPVAATVYLYWYWPADDGGHPVSHWKIERKQTALATGQTVTTNTAIALNTWGPITGGADGMTVQANAPGVSPDYTDTTADAGGKYQYRVTARTGDQDADTEGTTSSPSNTATTNAVVSNCDSIDAVDESEEDRAALAADRARFADQTARCALSDAEVPNDNVDAERDGKGNAEVTVTRENPRKATSFRIDVSPDGNKWRSVSSYVGNLGSDDEFVYEYLDERTGGDLHYRVFAYVGSTQLLPSNPAPQLAGVKEVSAPGKVENLQATPVSQTQIDVRWSAPMKDGDAVVDMYCVQIRDTGTVAGTDMTFDTLVTDTLDDSDTPAIEGGDDTAMSLCERVTGADADDTFVLTDKMSYSHKKLKAGQSRFYKVYAINNPVVGGDNRSVSSDTKSAKTMKQDKPGMPTGLVAEAAKDSNYGGRVNSGVYLLWNKPPNPGGGSVDSYVVQRKVDDGEWADLESDTGNPRTIYHHERPEPAEGEQRAYRVAAMNSSGTSGWSEMAYYPQDTSHGPIVTELTAPSGVKVSTLQNTISVTWDPASIENADQVKVALFDSGVTMIVDLKTFNAANDPGAATFTGVASGDYKVAVASFRTGDPHMLSALMDVTIQ